MNEGSAEFGSGRVLNFAIVLLGLLILIHTLPYVPEYRVPNYDLFNVYHVVNYLNTPDLYSGGTLARTLTEAFTSTAPVYFYGLVYPLSQFFSPKLSVLFVGFTITVISVYFSGGRWADWHNYLTAFVVIMILLHCTVNPLEGNRRSFTAFFILGALWSDRHAGFWGKLFLLALAAGIYPPVALLTLTYFGFRLLQGYRHGAVTIDKALGRLSGYVLVFLAVLSPFWFKIVSTTHTYSFVSESVGYDLTSLAGILKTFLLGHQEFKGALFRDTVQLDLFVIFLFMAGLQSVLNKRGFDISNRHRVMFFASLILWGCAHLLHPLIYHPFKYTRLSLLLCVAIPVSQNLPDTVRLLRSRFSRDTGLTFLLVIAGVWSLGIWMLYAIYPEPFGFLTISGFLGSHWWRFIFALPVFLTVILTLPHARLTPAVHTIIATAVLLALVFLPHDFDRVQWQGMKLKNFDDMYSYLRKTPESTLVAGPYFTDPIAVYGKRSIFKSMNTSNFEFVCRRSQRFWNAYFAHSPETILSFMNSRGITHLLVDRHLLKNRTILRNPDCPGEISPSGTTFLNRHFKHARWSFKKRFYLLDVKSIRKTVSDSPARSPENF